MCVLISLCIFAESSPSLGRSNVRRLFSGSRKENRDYGSSSAHTRSSYGFCSSLQTRRSDEENHPDCYRWRRRTWSPHVPHHLPEVCSSSHSHHRIWLYPKFYHVISRAEICYNDKRGGKHIIISYQNQIFYYFSVTPFFEFTNTP